jgi:type VII secretion-associated serine protease mycosin
LRRSALLGTLLPLCGLALGLIASVAAVSDNLRADQWHLRALEVNKAHEVSLGDGIVVAVLDTGVSPHPDLRRNLLPGTDVVPGGNGNGQRDTDGHGTAMAGLIAAHGRSQNVGALGIAPHARVLPVKWEGRGVQSDAAETAKAIDWARLNGADVISMSASVAPTASLVESLKQAMSDDIIIVASAGNRSTDVQLAYPAAMDGVLAVGASGRNGKHAAVSVPGKAVGICAPGERIVSTGLMGRMRTGTGTSPATAIVAGAAALVRSKYPDLSAREVVHRLTATADDEGKPGRDNNCGYGVLNIVKALTADVPPLDDQTAPTPSAASSEQAPGPPGGNAAGNRPARSNTPALVGGVTAIALLGGLLTMLALRRRRRSSTSDTNSTR